MRVVTWNIHYGAGPTLHQGAVTPRHEVIAFLDAIAGFLRDQGADVVALQEVDRAGRRTHGIDQLSWLRHATGLRHAAWTETWNARYVPFPGLDPRQHLGRVVSGQAVLSRFRFLGARRHALVQPRSRSRIYNLFYLHRALLDATIDLGPHGQLRVCNAHLDAFDVTNKEEHARTTAEVLAGCPPHTLLLGDMNTVPPEAAVRRGFPDEPHTDMSSDRTLPILRGIPGLTEVAEPEDYRADEGAWFTFPAHAPNRRLDYLFCGPALELRTAGVPQMRDPPSDHLPVVASFEFR